MPRSPTAPIPSRPRWWAPYALVFAVGTLLAMLTAAQSYLLSQGAGRPRAYSFLLLWQLPQWYVWAAATPAIAALVRRWPGRGVPTPALLAAHGLLCLLTVAVHSAVVTAADHLAFSTTEQLAGFGEMLVRHLRSSTQVEVLAYVTIAGAAYAFEYWRRYQEGRQRAIELRQQLVSAELRALKMQLHPHFLFNALHAIAALNRRDPDLASRTVMNLAGLLRHVLDASDKSDTTVEQEVRFLDQYLAIERVRFGDRLQVTFDIDPTALHARIPQLLLQPLVENAIRHGLGPKVGQGHLTLLAERTNGSLRLEIRDDGVGWPHDAREGVGLGNLRARLRHTYGDRAAFTIHPAVDSGTVARIVLPT